MWSRVSHWLDLPKSSLFLMPQPGLPFFLHSLFTRQPFSPTFFHCSTFPKLYWLVPQTNKLQAEHTASQQLYLFENYLPGRYQSYEKPSWSPGSSFGYIAAGYVVTGMLDGVAVFAGLQVSRYELFKSISTTVVFLFFKTFFLLWPVILFHVHNLIMVSTVDLKINI